MRLRLGPFLLSWSVCVLMTLGADVHGTDKLPALDRATTDKINFRGNFAPDGKAIALGAADSAIHIVPVDPQAEIRWLELHSDWVFDVAYTPDGKPRVSGGRDKTVKISSVETGKLLRAVDT